MDEEYRKQIEQIKIDEEELADKEMKSVYAEQRKALSTLDIMLGEMFIKYSIAGLLEMNPQQIAGMGIAEILKNIGKTLGEAEVKTATSILEKAYADTYYKNAFIMDSGLKVDLKFDILRKEFIDAAVNTKFADELFSDRIWTNKADMIDMLQTSLIDTMQGKTTIDKAGRNIRDTFNVSAYESQRLIRTENARIQSQASIDIAKNTGVKQHMWSATLDMKTNSKDASLDGKIYNIGDPKEPENPLHPNCRCCWINVPFNGWSPAKRIDNVTKQMIDYKSYDTWLKDKGI